MPRQKWYYVSVDDYLEAINGALTDMNAVIHFDHTSVTFQETVKSNSEGLMLHEPYMVNTYEIGIRQASKEGSTQGDLDCSWLILPTRRIIAFPLSSWGQKTMEAQQSIALKLWIRSTFAIATKYIEGSEPEPETMDTDNPFSTEQSLDKIATQLDENRRQK